MAIQSYEVDPGQVGLVVTMGLPRAHNGTDGRQAHNQQGVPAWQVSVLLADLDLEAPVRWFGPVCPDWATGSALTLAGKLSVSAFSGRVAGAQRASVTLRADRVELDASPDGGDLFGSDNGLYVVSTDRWVLGGAERLEATFRRQGDWVRYLVMRGWQSADGQHEGAERHLVDVPGRAPAGLKKLANVEFDGLRVESYLNDDRTRSSLSLTASSIRPAVERGGAGRSRRSESPAPVVEGSAVAS